MSAGKLDRRIQFQRFALVDDGFRKVETWADHGGTVAASKKDVSDGEKSRADSISATLTARFIVRSSAFSRDLTAKDRLTYKGETYAVFGIKELDRLKRLEITAGAKVDDAN